MAPGVVADFASGVQHGLPCFTVLRPQHVANHKEGDRHAVLFANVQHALHIFDMIAVIHGDADALVLAAAVAHGEAEFAIGQGGAKKKKQAAEKRRGTFHHGNLLRMTDRKNVRA